MTTLTLRFINGHFVVTGPDFEPMKFASRREAKTGAAGIIRAYRSLRSGGIGPGGWWRVRWGGQNTAALVSTRASMRLFILSTMWSPNV